jgi:hypothetical protein
MLNIEKVVKLLDDYHIELFKQYLEDIEAQYPLLLVKAIHRSPDVEQESDDLCKEVYGNSDKKTKQKFFQLAHHSFKLTSYLSKNFSSYLSPNLPIIQRYFNTGAVTKGKALSEILLDIAEKVEDFPVQISVLNILANYHALCENYLESLKLREKITTVITYQQIQNDLYNHILANFSSKGKPAKITDLDQHLQFFEQYNQHPILTVSLLSRWGYCQTLNYVNSPDFYTQATYLQLLAIEDDLRKYDYICFPFLEDLTYKVAYLKIRYLFSEYKMDAILQEAEQIVQNSNQIHFWQHIVHVPEIFAIAIQASYYLSNYMITYRSNHKTIVPLDVQKRIETLKERCAELLEQNVWGEQFIIRYINLKTVYSGLLIISSEEECKVALDTLEEMLVVYQQVPFHIFIDSIFINIIAANFILKSYPRLQQAYKRYKKLSEGKPVNIENDTIIHGFYYTSQWLYSQRKQYLVKLNKTIETVANTNYLSSTHRLLIDLVDYYNIPLDSINTSILLEDDD